MEWTMIIALLLIVPIVLFPVVFIWYLNAGGIWVVVKEGRMGMLQPVLKKLRNALLVIIPVASYAYFIWYAFSRFTWPAALAMVIAIPVVLFVPILIWIAVVSGLYQVARENMKQRVAPRRVRTEGVAKEPVTRETI